MTDSGFNDLREEILETGEPYIGGTFLKYNWTQVRIFCGTCGELLPENMRGWSSDWGGLCRQAMRHVEDTGHTVIPDLALRAIYGEQET